MSDKNVVDVIVPALKGAAPATNASSLTMQTVLNVMLYPNCAANPGAIQAELQQLESIPTRTKEQSEKIEALKKKINNCYWVNPRRAATVLATRGVAPVEAREKVAAIKADTNVYSAIAERLVSSGRPSDLEQVPQLLDMKTDSQYAGPSSVQAAKQELDSLFAMPTPTTEQKERIKQLQELLRGKKAAAGPLSDVEIRDITGRLGANSNRLSKDLGGLGQPAVVLYTVVGENSYHTILVAPNARPISWEGLDKDGHPVNREELRSLVNEFRNLLKYPDEDPRPQAAELYGILVGGHETNFEQAKTLVWVLDDDLRYVPTAALYDEKDQRYLAERYSNVVLTRSDTFELNSQHRELKALAAGVSEAHGDLQALKSVTKELNSIFYEEGTSTGNGRVPAKILMNDAFTPYSLRAALTKSSSLPAGSDKAYTLVHIASHFVFRRLHPDDSFLLLGDGKLSLAELKDPVNGYNFRGVELVTLSACETAKGSDSSNGIEIQSLGEILDSGAWAVMATLWEIDDASTSIFMQRFYGVLEEHKSKAEALQAAQLALLCGDAKCGSGKSAYSHPYYSSVSFILTGDWR